MAENQEELEVVLSLKDQLSKGMGNALNAVDNFKAGFNAMSKGARLAGTAIAASFALISRNIMATSEELVKMNKITGVGIERLQKLGLAAELNGSSLQSINVGLRQLARVATEAAAGSDEAAATFKKLGISATDVNGNVKEMEALFDETVEAISKIENRTERASTALRVFGRAGTELLPVIEEGKAGFEKFGKIAEDMGIVISKDTVEALEAFGDQMTVLKEAGKSLVAEGLLKIGQALPYIIEGFISFSKTVNYIKENIVGFVKDVGAHFGFILSLASKVKTDIANLFSSTGEQSKTLTQLLDDHQGNLEANAREYNAAITDSNALLDAMNTKVQKTLETIAGGKDKVKETTAAISGSGGMTDGLQKLFDAQSQIQLTWEANRDELQRLESSVKAVEEALKAKTAAAIVDKTVSAEEAKEIETLRMAHEHAQSALENYKKAQEDSKNKQDEFNRSVEEAGRLSREAGFELTADQLYQIALAAQESGVSVRDMISEMEQLRDSDPLLGLQMAFRDLQKQTFNYRTAFTRVFNDLESSVSNAIEGMISGTVKAKDALKQLYRDIKKSFIKMISDMAAKALVQQVLGLLGVGAGGGGGGGGGGGATAAMGGGGSGGAITAATGAGGASSGLGGVNYAGAAASAAGGIAGGTGAFGVGTGTYAAAAGVAAGVGDQYAGKGNVTASTLSYAAAGAAAGAILGPVGLVVGALVGAAYGYYAGSKQKKKIAKAKAQARAAEAERLRQLEEQKKQAAALLRQEIQNNYGGGLASPDQAAAIGELFSGDITSGDIDKLGINPQQVVDRAGSIQNQSVVNNMVGAPNITINVGSIASHYDVQNLAQDLGYYLTGSAYDGQNVNPG